MGWQPLETGDAVLLATACALGASIIGGTAGGLLVRKRPTAATLVAVATSWPVGIVLLPAAASALGIRLRAVISCFDSCTAYLTDERPWSGFAAYVSALDGAVMIVVPLVVAILLLVGAVAARRELLGSVLVVAAYAALHFWTLVGGGFIPFACLAVGAVVWAALLGSPRTAPVPSPSPDTRMPAG